MIAALGDFVPLALNTAFTQYRDDDAVKEFFHKVVDPSDWMHAQEGKTTQGMYACGSDGVLLAFTFAYDVDLVLETLRKAKQEFAKHPPKKVALPGPKGLMESPPPEGTLIASVYTRIAPLPKGASSDNGFLGRDHLWILREELRALRRGEFPAKLRTRLARWHLWDNVRGEPDAWKAEQVEKADLRATVVSAERVKITGEFRISAPAGKRGEGDRDLPASGYEGTLAGEIDWNGKDDKVSRLVLLAEGEAWGESTFTPGAPPGKFPLKIAIVLPAPDDPTSAVSPQGISWDADAYLGR